MVKPFLSENACSFNFFSTIKVKLVSEMTQRAYLCLILHVKHKKLPFIAILTWFLILGKIQNGGQDGDHCWWSHRSPAASPPIKYTSSCWVDQRLSTEGKIVSKYCNISKTLLRSSIHPTRAPPPARPSYHGGGLRVRPRVNPIKLIWIFCFSHLL